MLSDCEHATARRLSNLLPVTWYRSSYNTMAMYMKSVVLLFKAGLYSVVLNKMKVDRLVGTSATTGKLINRTAGLLRQTCYDVSWYSDG